MATDGSSELPSDGPGSPSGSSLDTFAGRLDYLFLTVHPQGHRPYSYEHVAEAVSSGGIDISGNYIWMLRSGRRDNPTLRHMEGLARFFGVSTSFLTDRSEAERVRDQLAKLNDLAASGVQHVAMRGSKVDDETLDTIHSLLDRVLQLTDGLRPTGQQAATSSDGAETP